MLGKAGSYSAATLCTLVLHAGLVFVVTANWTPEREHRKAVTPKYIDAKLVELKAKEEPKAKPKKQPDNQKKIQQQKEAERKAAEAKKKAQAEKRRKAEAEKKRQAKIKREREEAEKKRIAEEKKQQELEKQRKEELLSALDDEQEFLIAENDEQIANSYQNVIQQKIQNNWSRPPSARRDMEATVEIQLVPTGRVVSVRIIKSSGNDAFDRSVEQAVRKADSFPELKKMESRVFESYFRNLQLVFRPDDLRL
ncbi:cell envelope integrity protein TolA [Porticoccaceae bacterium LTM1]|nr:cell envelope integrity protein TolA [Porticoccaceae bacterium LTM1]